MTEFAGWLGMILIHCATLPTMINILRGEHAALPPLSMVLLVWAGLALFLLRSIGARDKLSIISNAFGFIMQSVMLAIIVLR